MQLQFNFYLLLYFLVLVIYIFQLAIPRVLEAKAKKINIIRSLYNQRGSLFNNDSISP